ncbi:DUF2316 family protein [Corynebacterium hadale]|uniref:DUF2316 family protein n=1 Tax=Corynebacterium hadale TaxID=2026255 RepID=UPI000BAA6CA0|nr:DUF2316 family protein [Corynebacterium hadale]PAT07771.1 hypothetical protein CKJ82_08970 [Corynebacterium hadale]
MSLNAQQMGATRRELAANFERSGLTVSGIAKRLTLNDAHVTQALAVTTPHPLHVWMVRDTLKTAVKEAGGELVPYSSLTEANRKRARMWFGVEDYRWGVWFPTPRGAARFRPLVSRMAGKAAAGSALGWFWKGVRQRGN